GGHVCRVEALPVPRLPWSVPRAPAAERRDRAPPRGDRPRLRRALCRKHGSGRLLRAARLEGREDGSGSVGRPERRRRLAALHVRPGDELMPSPAVALRRVRLGDAPAVLDAFADEEMSRQGDVHDEATATAYTQRLVDNPYAFAVDEGGTLIGVVAITADQENRLGWFWYWTHRAHRGRGLAGRAAATVANWALRDGGLERLELGHRVDNPASGAVARAAGFVQEGVERGKFLVDGERIDVLTYGRLRTDPWPATPGLPMDTSED